MPPGSVYLVVSADSGETWSEQQKLLASDKAAGDEFGVTVAVYNNTILVGASLNDNERWSNAG